MKTVREMLEALKATHLSDVEVAEKTGIPQPTITRLRNGQHEDTNYTYGKRVEALYAEVCGKAAA